MSILRKRLDTSFTVVPNELLDDHDLDLGAKGLVALMLSKPDGWSFSAERLARVLPEGREAIRNALGRAESAGWVLRVDKRAPNGQIRREVLVRNTRLLDWDTGGSTDVGSTEVGSTEVGATVAVSNTEVARTEVARTDGETNAAPGGASVDNIVSYVPDRWPYFIDKLRQQDDAWKKVTVGACVKIAKMTDTEAVSTALSFAAMNAPVLSGSAYGWLKAAAQGLHDAREGA